MPLFIKIILWILLGLFLLILWLLICPIMYKIKVHKKDNQIEARVWANYLLGLVRVGVIYPKPEKMEQLFYIKILCFSLGKKKKEKKPKEEKNEETQSNEAEPVATQETVSEEQSITTTEVNTAEAENTDSSAENTSENSTEQVLQEETQQTSDTSSDESAKKKSLFEKLTDTKDTLEQKVEKAKKEYQFYKKLLEAEFTKTFLRDAKIRLFHVLRNLLPRVIRGNVVFGGNTPDVTGYAMAGYGALICARRRFNKVMFTPNFEESQLDLDLKIKGHFSLIMLIWNGLRLFFDRRFRRIRAVLKKHKDRESK